MSNMMNAIDPLIHVCVLHRVCFNNTSRQQQQPEIPMVQTLGLWFICVHGSLAFWLRCYCWINCWFPIKFSKISFVWRESETVCRQRFGLSMELCSARRFGLSMELCSARSHGLEPDDELLPHSLYVVKVGCSVELYCFSYFVRSPSF